MTEVDATGTANGQQLGIALIAGAAPPQGACANFTPLGDGSYVVFDHTAGTNPSLIVTITLDKALVKQGTDRGRPHFDVCIGAARLDSSTTPFHTKDGSLAVPIFDPVFGVTVFWGVLLDCSSSSPSEPCVPSRGKGPDETITVNVPYPWDPGLWVG
jgi:hypothetical protein